MSEFYVGQKVVCVDDAFSPSWHVVKIRPSIGVTYTIRGLTIIDFEKEAGVLCALLAEVKNPIELWHDGTRSEMPFWIGRFRPLQTKAIEIFRAIAANPTIKIRETA